ncbi:hypothetical protein [Tabrizicola sp.]|uniref:hypothetical protein n=1 Tax=Tabrizicola sp. TaxID=2005166 RepID=UPI00286D4E1B|nr:hypothetical protein [Tabrizicola sp.]
MERTEENTLLSAPDKVLEGSYLDWAAIFGGAVVAVAIASVFTGFGAALGLSTISAEPGEGSFNLMLILSAIWVVVTLVASYMAGGYIAGRMRRRVDSVSADEVTARDGLNGLVVWGLGIIVSVFVLGTAVSTTVATVGAVASGAGAVAGSVVQATGTVVAEADKGAITAVAGVVQDDATTGPMDYLNRTLLRPNTVGTTPADPATMAGDTAAILGNVLKTGEISDPERAYLVSAVVTSTGATPAEAATRVDAAIIATQTARSDAEKGLADAKAEADKLAADAEAVAIKATEVARVSAILSAFLLASAAMVAAAAAYVGAVRGGRHRDEGRIFGGFAYRG